MSGPSHARTRLVEPLDLTVPRWPAALVGLRIAHVSDTHCRKPRKRHRVLIDELARAQPDLLLLTGDYMTHPGDEPAALDLLQQLTDRVTPTLGTFGVFGNHDSPDFVQRAQRELPAVRWLLNQTVRVQASNGPIDLWGLHTQGRVHPDAVALTLSATAPDQPRLAHPNDPDRPPRLLLSHFPDTLANAADIGIDIVFAGHTHGGQIRLPNAKPLRNSSPLPLHLTTGKLRHRDTVALVSRGLGEMTLPLRLFCSPHAPVYTMQQGPLAKPNHGAITCLWSW